MIFDREQTLHGPYVSIRSVTHGEVCCSKVRVQVGVGFFTALLANGNGNASNLLREYKGGV